MISFLFYHLTFLCDDGVKIQCTYQSYHPVVFYKFKKEDVLYYYSVTTWKNGPYNNNLRHEINSLYVYNFFIAEFTIIYQYFVWQELARKFLKQLGIVSTQSVELESVYLKIKCVYLCTLVRSYTSLA